MTRALLLLLGVVVGAAAGAGAAYVTLQPRIETLENDLLEAERGIRDANRLARAEHDRNRVLEEELETLRRIVDQPPPATTSGPETPAPPAPGLEPEDWDMKRLQTEFELLASLRARMIGSPRVARVARGVRKHGAAGTKLVLDILASRLSVNMKMAAALVGAEIGEPRILEPVLALYAAATEVPHRRAFLRALADLPDERATAVLLAAWTDAAADARLRMPAIYGLALRAHPVALELARRAPDAPVPRMRALAIETLHERARSDGYTDPALLEVFLGALTTADGESQQRLALIAIEGHWSTDAVPVLREFAADEQAPEAMRVRAAKLAERLSSGEKRPEDAGEPTEADRAARSSRRLPVGER